MVSSETHLAYVWITSCIISFVVFLSNTILAYKEYKTRKSHDVLFVTRWLRLWSILCISFGSIGLLTVTLHNLPPFCYFSLYLMRILNSLPPLFMTFYQLSRLYYCFSRDKAYSDKGYPNWLFIIMFGLAILCYLSFIISTIDHYVTSCGINNEYKAYINYKNFGNYAKYVWILGILTAVHITSEILTLMLYIYKIYTFTKRLHKNNNSTKIKNRILSILNKISIITMFYQFISILIVLIWIYIRIAMGKIIFDVLYNLIPLLYSYSMYIMLDHNKKSYQWFLKILYRFKLYFVCYCCCKQMIFEQWSNIKSLELTINENKSDGDCDNVPQTENTEYDKTIEDISENHGKIEIRQQFSIETTIN